MSDAAAEAPRLRLPGLVPLLFGALPLLAALGPLLSLYRGLFAFRLACVFVIAHAVLFLLGRTRWEPADVLLAASAVSFGIAGTLGLPFIAEGSQDPYSEFLAIMLGLLTALAVRAWQRRDARVYLHLARGWILASLLSCAIAGAEVVTGRHLPGYEVAATPDPAAAFGNPNALAVFLVMGNVWAIPVHRAGGVRWRLAALALLVGTGPVLFLTGARLALVTWLLVVAWSAWVAVLRSRHRIVDVAGSLLPVGAALALIVTVPVVLDYLGEISDTGTSGNVREQLTRQGLEFSVEHRGLPTWPGSFEALMGERGDLDAVADLVNAHNVWVEILVQYGLISLVLLLGFLVACLLTGTGSGTGRRTWDERVIAVAALLVLGIVDSSSLDDAGFWLFVITLAAATRVPATPQVEAPHPRETLAA